MGTAPSSDLTLAVSEVEIGGAVPWAAAFRPSHDEPRGLGLDGARTPPSHELADQRGDHVVTARVLVVDDDEQIRTVVTWHLEHDGFQVASVRDGEAALAAVEAQWPDLLILDLTLPGLGGLDVLALLRRRGGLPVIVLTARGTEHDRVAGLDLGADDYLVKPFSLAELSARVRSVLRRSQVSEPATVLEFGRLCIDLRAHRVTRDEEVVVLTAKEFDLLAFLAGSPRTAFTRSTLLREVWGSSPRFQQATTVTEHVHRLRRKLEDDPARPRWIRTVRGSGYAFEP